MCGIAGLVTQVPTEHHLKGLRRAIQALHHRGPDDEGFLLFPAADGAAALGSALPSLALAGGRGPLVALGHRRLSIIDLSPAGRQPMSTSDGQLHIVLNGEIYNYLELRTELEHLGHRFVSRTDTEVALYAFQQWGVAALRRLVGMFGLAVLDVRRRKLVLARDCFGIKPLYYAESTDGIAFASEIGALLEFPGVTRRVNAKRLYDYLDHSDTDEAEETLFADVRQILPAHYLEILLDSIGSASPIRYWEVDRSRESELSFEGAAARLRELFLESVALHLRSDVPLGVALSGGTDSSAVLAAARHLLGPRSDLHAFTYAASDPTISEARYALIAAGAAQAHLHTVEVKPHELAEDYRRLQGIQGEPFQGPTIYAQYRVFGLARSNGLKVILEGQGSDELLAGYTLFMPARLATLVRRDDWGPAFELYRRWGGTRIDRKTLALGTIRLLVPRTVHETVVRLRRAQHIRQTALDLAWFTQRGVRTAPPWRAEGKYVMREHLHHMLTKNPLQALMRYGDRNAMAFSLENRVPFLTAPLVEFIFSLPESYVIGAEGTTKTVFRRAMRGLVPDPILDRRDKIGFATPAVSWLLLLRPWVEEGLRAVTALPGLRADGIQEKWKDVQARGRYPDGIRIWRWLSLATWAEVYSVRFD